MHPPNQIIVALPSKFELPRDSSSQLDLGTMNRSYVRETSVNNVAYGGRMKIVLTGYKAPVIETLDLHNNLHVAKLS